MCLSGFKVHHRRGVGEGPCFINLQMSSAIDGKRPPVGSIRIIQGEGKIMGGHLSEGISLPDSYSPNATNCTSVATNGAVSVPPFDETCLCGRSAVWSRHQADGAV